MTETITSLEQPATPNNSKKKIALLFIAGIFILLGIDHVTTHVVSGEKKSTADSTIVAPAKDTIKVVAPVIVETAKKDTTKKAVK
jgi:hypothetical protein